jgi:hypothetical protein
MNPVVSKSEQNWAVVSHLIALSMLVGVPLGNIVGPLIVWLVKKNEGPFVDYHARESLNFQISITIYLLIAALLILVLIGWLLMAILIVADVILVIIAAMEASKGNRYRYPFTLRLIK